MIHPMTDNQLGMLSYLVRSNRLTAYFDAQPTLERNGQTIDYTLQNFERWCRLNIDKMTASDLISFISGGKHGVFLNQIDHLGFKTKPYVEQVR